jgi:hypothetical protein
MRIHIGSGFSVRLFGFWQAGRVFSRKVRKSMLECFFEGWRPHLKPFYGLRINKKMAFVVIKKSWSFHGSGLDLDLEMRKVWFRIRMSESGSEAVSN